MLIESTGVIGHRIKKVKEDLHVSLFYLRLLVIGICMILSCVQFFHFCYLFFYHTQFRLLDKFICRTLFSIPFQSLLVHYHRQLRGTAFVSIV